MNENVTYGSVYQREQDSKWVATAHVPTKKGRRKRLATYGKTRKEAKQSIISKVKAHMLTYYDTTTDLTFNEVAIEWLEIHKRTIASSTYDLYDLYIKNIFGVHMKDVGIAELSAKDLNDFLSERIGEVYAKGKAPRSVNTVRKFQIFIRQVFKYAMMNEYLTKNVALNMSVIKSKKTEVAKVLPKDEFNRLLLNVKDTPDEIPIILAGITGLRRSEIFALNWKDIDFDNEFINVNKAIVRVTSVHEKDTKTYSSTRQLPLYPFVAKILKDYKSREGLSDGLVCPQYKCTYYSQRFNKLVKHFEIQPPIRFHDLRHYNATMTIASGVDLKIVSEWLGHSDTSTTVNIYQHTIKETNQKAIDTMTKIFLGENNDESPEKN